MGELVDRVRLAVAPVLEELGRRPGVVDLVEVHPVRLREAERAEDERADHDHHEQPQVEPVESTASLAVEPAGSVGQEGPHGPEPEREGQPGTGAGRERRRRGPGERRRRRQQPPVVDAATAGLGILPDGSLARPDALADLAGRLVVELAGLLGPFPACLHDRLAIESADRPRAELGQRPDEGREVDRGHHRDAERRPDRVGQAEPVLHARVVEVGRQEHRVEVREAGQRQDDVGDPPAGRRGREDRAERDEREEIAFVDPRRRHEEGDRQDRQRHDQQATIVEHGPDRGARQPLLVDDHRRRPSTSRHHDADERDDRDQERRADVDGRDPGDQRRDLVGLVPGHVPQPQPVRGQTVAILAEERPGVVRVDRDVRVAAGRLGDLLEEADERHPEREAQPDRRRERDRRAGHQPDRSLAQPGQPPVATRSGGQVPGTGGDRRGPVPPQAIPEVAPEKDDRQDRDEDPELRLDDRRDHRQERRPLGTTAPQLAQAEEQEDDAERIDLAPDRAVEPGDRIDHDQDRPDAGRPARPAELPDERMDEPGQNDVGQDRRQLDQVADPADGVADEPDQPQDVQVAGGVVDEEPTTVEPVRSVRRQLAGPGLKRVPVRAEAGAREQDVCDDEAEGQPEDQDRDERQGGLERPRRRCGASVGHTGSGGCQGGPPPARALRWSGV